jgi:hypothetical protein
MRANAGSDCLLTTPSRRSAAAFSSGATLERIIHRVVEPAIAAAPTVLARRSQVLHGEGTRDATQNLSRIGRRVSLLHNSQGLLTPSLDRATSQQQKQHPGNRHNQQLPGREATQHAQGGGHPNRGRRRKAMHLPVGCLVKNHAGAKEANARDDPWMTREASACRSCATASTASAEPSAVRTPVGL